MVNLCPSGNKKHHVILKYTTENDSINKFLRYKYTEQFVHTFPNYNFNTRTKSSGHCSAVTNIIDSSSLQHK